MNESHVRLRVVCALGVSLWHHFCQLSTVHRQTTENGLIRIINQKMMYHVDSPVKEILGVNRPVQIAQAPIRLSASTEAAVLTGYRADISCMPSARLTCLGKHVLSAYYVGCQIRQSWSVRFLCFILCACERRSGLSWMHVNQSLAHDSGERQINFRWTFRTCTRV